MQNEPFSFEAAIFALSIVFLILGAFIIMILIVYRKRRNAHTLEKINWQNTFKQEMLKLEMEVQEQTLHHISQELHDNIGQVLSFIKLNLAQMGRLEGLNREISLMQSRELLGQSINDLRALSKSISFEHIKTIGLIKTIEREVERINHSGLLRVTLRAEPESFNLSEQHALVFFRIFQEGLNNTLKHANATHFDVHLQYQPPSFSLCLRDDGVGFAADIKSANSGSGLHNIKSRAALIGAQASVSSACGQGCCIRVVLPLNSSG